MLDKLHEMIKEIINIIKYLPYNQKEKYLKIIKRNLFSDISMNIDCKKYRIVKINKTLIIDKNIQYYLKENEDIIKKLAYKLFELISKEIEYEINDNEIIAYIHIGIKDK